MRHMRPRRPSPALVISILALVVAAAGTSYAAFRLPKNSVGTSQIKADAVTSAKVKNRSLVARDFRRGQIPAGARGLQGLKGDTGAPATALWAAVDANGTLLGGTATAAAENTTGVPNQYDVTFSRDVSRCIAIANQGFSLHLPASTATYGTDSLNAFPGFDRTGAAAPTKVEVMIHRSSTQNPVSEPFELAVFC